jgi:hypothetical protein
MKNVSVIAAHVSFIIACGLTVFAKTNTTGIIFFFSTAIFYYIVHIACLIEEKDNH